MDQRAIPPPRVKPLPPEHSPELKKQFEAMQPIPRSALLFGAWPRHWLG